MSVGTVIAKKRDSNMEILRIVAMIFIMVIHVQARYYINPANGYPLIDHYAMIFMQFIVIVGVNVFVLISGWFGIRPTLQGLARLLFQCVMVTGISYTIGLLSGTCQLSLAGVLNVLTAYKLWFIPSYIGLYIFAPALNLWIRHMSRNAFKRILIIFFVFEMIYGFLVPDINPIGFGESTISFFGLYLLARYFYIYRPGIVGKSAYCFLIYLSCALLNTIVYCVAQIRFPVATGYLWMYINPLIILGSLGLMLTFASLKVPFVAIVNKLASSALAAYLVHITLWNIYTDMMRYIFQDFQYPLSLLMMLTAIIVIYVISYMIDGLRKILWNKLYKVYADRHPDTTAAL